MQFLRDLEKKNLSPPSPYFVERAYSKKYLICFFGGNFGDFEFGGLLGGLVCTDYIQKGCA
jgi:hypothetical protein